MARRGPGGEALVRPAAHHRVAPGREREDREAQADVLARLGLRLGAGVLRGLRRVLGGRALAGVLALTALVALVCLVALAALTAGHLTGFLDRRLADRCAALLRTLAAGLLGRLLPGLLARLGLLPGLPLRRAHLRLDRSGPAGHRATRSRATAGRATGGTTADATADATADRSGRR
ncbi:hypothetical protein J7S33_19610, partial [Saccharothrix algeriensis]